MAPPPDDPFFGHLKLIQEVIQHSCRRYHFRPEEAEEFSSSVMLKLMEDDYRILREYKGRSSFKTFLTVVIQRQLLDHLNRIWGKWRPCEEAKRIGPLAIQLDRMLHRDELTFDEACNQLQHNHGVTASWQELQSIAARLPARIQRHLEGEEELRNAPDWGLTPEELLLEKERAGERRRIKVALYRAIQTLPADDRLLILMWLQFKVRDIARMRGVEDKPLYRRIEKIREALRKALEREGVRRQDIDEILRSHDP